jgi:hypothetical protein
MSPGRRRWIWAGRAAFAVIVGGFLAYVFRVGLDKADKTASVVSAVLAILALGLPYLSRSPQATVSATEIQPPAPGTADIHVSDTGKAVADADSKASTGMRAPAEGLTGRFTVERTGDAEASDGGTANTGIWLG